MKRVYSDCNLKCKAVVRKWFRWKFALCIWIILVFSGPVEGQDLKKIRVAIPALSMTSFSTLIPREKGYWRDEGLDVEVVVVRAAASVLALEAREVDFITVGGGGLLGILRGLPLRVVFTPFRRPTYAIYAWPEIRSMQELKGKKVGVSSIGSGPDSLLRDLLKKKMADGGLNVTILAVGGGAERFAALQTRTVDAAILSNPSTLMAKQAGFHELYSFMKEKDYTDVTTATITRDELIKSNPAVVEKFIRGQVKGLMYMQEYREAATSIMSRALKITKELALSAYDELQPAVTENGTVNEDEQRKSLEHLIERLKLKEVPPLENVYDFSIERRVYKDLQARGWKPSE